MAGPRKSLKYLSEAEVIAINEEMVAKFGGLHGVRDLNMLSLAVGRPQMSVAFQDAYKTIFDKQSLKARSQTKFSSLAYKAAALLHSIINNHPFLDGNKRTSFFSAILFLEYNGWTLDFKRKEGVKFTRKAHKNDYTVEPPPHYWHSHLKAACIPFHHVRLFKEKLCLFANYT